MSDSLFQNCMEIQSVKETDKEGCYEDSEFLKHLCSNIGTHDLMQIVVTIVSPFYLLGFYH